MANPSRKHPTSRSVWHRRLSWENWVHTKQQFRLQMTTILMISKVAMHYQTEVKEIYTDRTTGLSTWLLILVHVPIIIRIHKPVSVPSIHPINLQSPIFINFPIHSCLIYLLQLTTKVLENSFIHVGKYGFHLSGSCFPQQTP